MADDYSSNFQTTTGVLPIGSTIRARIDHSGDQDAFAMTLTGGEVYTVWIGTDAGDAQAVDRPQIVGFYDSSGALLPGLASYVGIGTFTAPTSGTHYVLVSSGQIGATGNYKLSAITPAMPPFGANADWVDWSPAHAYWRGGDGRDMLSFAAATEGVIIGAYRGQFQFASEDGRGVKAPRQFDGFEGFTGTSFDDRFITQGYDHDSNFVTAADAYRFRGLYGDDYFGATDLAAVYDGGAGNDTVSFFMSDEYIDTGVGDGVSASLLAGRGWSGNAAGDRFIDVENLRGSARADLLTGDRGDNLLQGESGHDTLIGNAGNDTIDGGRMDFNGSMGGWDIFVDVAVFNYDRVFYDIRRFSDRDWEVTYTGPGNGDGTDRLRDIEVLRFADGDLSIQPNILNATGAAENFSGPGALADTVSYQASDAAVSASLLAGRGWTGFAAGDRFEFMENLTGSDHADTLTGDHGDNILRGGAGDDTLIANGGRDVLHGGDGTDVAVFSYAKPNYWIGHYAANTVVSFHGAGIYGDGLVTLYDVEVLRFADGDMIL